MSENDQFLGPILQAIAAADDANAKRHSDLRLELVEMVRSVNNELDALRNDMPLRYLPRAEADARRDGIGDRLTMQQADITALITWRVTETERQRDRTQQQHASSMQSWIAIASALGIAVLGFILEIARTLLLATGK